MASSSSLRPGPLRIAQCLGQMNYGGVEAVVTNYYCAMDRDRIQFDFFVEENSSLPRMTELEALGARFYRLPMLSRGPNRYVRALRDHLREEGPAIVHAHMSTLNVFPLWAAVQAGVPVRICHTHTTDNPGEGKKSVMKRLLRPIAARHATDLFACGKVAAQWMYGSHAEQAHILPNAIDLRRFSFDQARRENARQALGLTPDTLALGHVGRFCYQKNHAFLIEMFACLLASRKDAVLLLIGDGELQAEVRTLAQRLGIIDRVMFIGTRTDVETFYDAMDVFLLPSYYEGLPVSGLEAQASGLRCVFSENVTREAGLLSSTQYLPLEDMGAWVSASIAAGNKTREQDLSALSAAGFDIHVQAQWLADFYEAKVQTIM